MRVQVEFVGGYFDGKTMDCLVPLLHRLMMPTPPPMRLEVFGSLPVRYEPPRCQEYYLIPGKNQYCTVDTPQWRRYMKECQEKVLEQLEAEWSEEDGNGTV